MCVCVSWAPRDIQFHVKPHSAHNMLTCFWCAMAMATELAKGGGGWFSVISLICCSIMSGIWDSGV